MVLVGKKFPAKVQNLGHLFFSRDKVVLLGIPSNNKLTFEVHIENLCKKHHTSYMPYKEKETF